MSDLATPPPSAPPPTDAPEPARKRSRRGKVIGVVLVGVFIAILAALTIYAKRTSPSGAAVGDCLRRGMQDAVAVVPCGDPEAEFEVVGRVEDQTEIEAGISTCSPFADQGATQVYWEGEQGGTGFVLCLADSDA
jgi:hypothetical protein